MQKDTIQTIASIQASEHHCSLFAIVYSGSFEMQPIRLKCVLLILFLVRVFFLPRWQDEWML